MIRLISFKVDGFQAINRTAEVIFAHDPVSIIYGDNGCGKTTFLKLIHSALNHDAAALLEENVNKISITFSADDEPIQTIEISRLSLIEDNENAVDIQSSYDWRELDESALGTSRSLSIGVDRGVTTQPGRIDPEAIDRFISTNPRYRDMLGRLGTRDFSYRLTDFLQRNQLHKNRRRVQELSFSDNHVSVQSIEIANVENLLLEQYRVARSIATEKIQNALFDTLASVIEKDNQPQVFKAKNTAAIAETLLKSKERIIEALKAGPDNNFKSQVIQNLINIKKEEDLELVLKNEILGQLIFNMVSELQIEKQLLSSINTLVATFNDFLVGDKELIINSEEMFIKVGTNTHAINYLSSGERHILTFLSLVVTVARTRDFLIIDEPEISLNIKWQRTLMELLQALVPRTQIIVASHSPIIAKKKTTSMVKLAPEDAA